MARYLQLDRFTGVILVALAALQIAALIIAGPARAGLVETEQPRLTLRGSIVPQAVPPDPGWSLRLVTLHPFLPRLVEHDPKPDALPLRPDLFGSVAVSMPQLAISGRWEEIVDERAYRFFLSGCSAGAGPCAMPGWRRWTRLHASASRLSGSDLLAHVNVGVNRLVRYRTDRELYGRADHWATLTETVHHGAGDCEDIAIAKMWMLKALGVPLDAMALIAVRDSRRGLDHAVLAVRMGKRTLILDNVHDRLIEHHDIAHYRPMFSVSATESWVHGFRRAPERVSSLDTRPGDASR